MKNFKKVIAGALALLMLALSVNVSFAAESYTEEEAVVVAKVNAAGIMTGTDKGFEPSKTLTRAEAAAIMVRTKGISEDTVKQNAGTTLFTDVAASHWAAGYINVASNYNLIKGVGANKFAPEKEVTVAEFYTMAIRALGAGQLVEAEGTWPTNYVNFAIENELAEDVAQVYSAASTRLTAATIIANTLEANMWVKDSVRTNGEITWKEDATKTILDSILHISEFKGITIDKVQTKDRKADFTDGLASEKTLFTKTNCKVGENANLSSVKKGQTYTVWYDRDDKEVVGFWVPDENDQISFTEIKKFDATNKKITLLVDGEEEKYDFHYNDADTPACDAKFYLNGKEIENPDDYTTTLPAFGIAYIKDGDVKDVYAETYENAAVVKEVKNDKIYFEIEDMAYIDAIKHTTTLTLKLGKDDKEVYKVTKDGKEIDVKDIEAGDALYWYVNGKEYNMVVVNDTVEGKVVASTSKKVEIDGEEYDLLASELATVKDEGTFYLYNGKISMWHKDKEDKGNFAVIGDSRVINGTEKGKYDFQVKLVSLDGTVGDWTTVDVKETNKKFRPDENTTVYDVEKTGSNTTGDIDKDTKFDEGHIVTYTTKSNKVVFTKDIDEVQFYGYVDATKDYISTDSTHLTAATVDADEKYFITSSTVVAELVKDDDEFTLRILDAEDIDTVFTADTTKLFGYAADFDKNEVGIVLFAEDKSEVKTDNTWAYVREVTPYTKDGDDEIVRKIKVVFAGDSTDTILYSKDAIGALDPDDMVGNVYNLAVTDKVITKATQKDLKSMLDASGALDSYTYLYKDYSDNMKCLANASYDDTDKKLTVVASDYYVVDENVIAIKITLDDDDEIDKREISSFDYIDALDQEDKDDTPVDADVDTIVNYWLEEVDDEFVIVAVEYINNEK